MVINTVICSFIHHMGSTVSRSLPRWIREFYPCHFSFPEVCLDTQFKDIVPQVVFGLLKVGLSYPLRQIMYKTGLSPEFVWGTRNARALLNSCKQANSWRHPNRLNTKWFSLKNHLWMTINSLKSLLIIAVPFENKFKESAACENKDYLFTQGLMQHHGKYETNAHPHHTWELP